MERWKFIRDTENKYKISNYGNVVAMERTKKFLRHGKLVEAKTKPKKIKFQETNGYYRVYLTSTINGKPKWHRVHHLVLTHFGRRPLEAILQPKKYSVNHKDGNKKNNHIDNLEWMTHKENIQHSWRIGLRTLKYDREQIKLDYENGMTYNEIAEKHGCSYSTAHKYAR